MTQQFTKEDIERLERMLTAATEHHPKHHDLAGQVRYYLVPPAVMDKAIAAITYLAGENERLNAEIAKMTGERDNFIMLICKGNPEYFVRRHYTEKYCEHTGHDLAAIRQALNGER